MRQETYHTSKRTPTGLEYARKRQVQIHREGGYDSRENRRRRRPKGRKNQKAAYLLLVILAIAAAVSVGSFIQAYGTLIKEITVGNFLEKNWKIL